MAFVDHLEWLSIDEPYDPIQNQENAGLSVRREKYGRAALV